MTIPFRAVQGLTAATLLGMWIVRSLTHPNAHPMLLVLTAVVVGLSELSYRAGVKDGLSRRPRGSRTER